MKLETKIFGSAEYWSPFEKFLSTQTKLRDKWKKHYASLGIRTKYFEGKLWVHLADDKKVYDRDIPALEKSTFRKNKT